MARFLSLRKRSRPWVLWGLALGLAGCGQDCPDLQYLACSSIGLSEHGQGYCDDCGTLWVCQDGKPPLEEEPRSYIHHTSYPCTYLWTDGYIYVPDYLYSRMDSGVASSHVAAGQVGEWQERPLESCLVGELECADGACCLAP